MPTQLSAKLAEKISGMRRRRIVTLLRKLDCGFQLDLTDEFLRTTSLTSLRHITLAAALHARNLPKVIT